MDAQNLDRILGLSSPVLTELCHRYELPLADAEDMLQEAALALLPVEGTHSDSFYISLALWAAMDWVRSFYHTRTVAGVVSGVDLVALERKGEVARLWS